VPQQAAIQKLALLGILDGGVGAGYGVAGLFELAVGVILPAAFGPPVGHRRDGVAGHLHVVEDCRVVWNLHLVDGDAIGAEVYRLANTLAPVAVGLDPYDRD